jgi:SAM-dependent methyltransferase
VNKRPPIDVFSDWANNGKDIGMEKSHEFSVNKMIVFSTKKLNNFTFLDAGCGNGWVIRKVSKLKNCIKAIGIDGSKTMIEKAKSIDKNNEYYCKNLLNWKPKTKIDLVHSMEVFYYFENPKKLINHIYSSWLKKNSRLIIGLDYYYENKISHSWSNDCGISIMSLFSEKEWEKFFSEVGFKKIKSWKVGAKKDWTGTLVITGIK